MSIIERIRSIVDNEGLSITAFETSIDISKGYLKVLENRNSLPGIEIILKIVDKYPNYSLIWILTGEGSMISGEKEKPSQEDARIEDIIADKVVARLEPAIGEMADRVLEAVLKVSFSVDSIKSDHEDIKDIQERTYQLIEKKQ